LQITEFARITIPRNRNFRNSRISCNSVFFSNRGYMIAVCSCILFFPPFLFLFPASKFYSHFVLSVEGMT